MLDGRGAWGMVAAARAMRIAISKAQAGGLGACVVRDTGNSQAMGYYPRLAVQQGHQTFLERVDTLVDLIHASPTAPGVERVLVQGERSGQTAHLREQRGILLSTERIAELATLSRDLGVQLPPALATNRPEI